MLWLKTKIKIHFMQILNKWYRIITRKWHFKIHTQHLLLKYSITIKERDIQKSTLSNLFKYLALWFQFSQSWLKCIKFVSGVSLKRQQQMPWANTARVSNTLWWRFNRAGQILHHFPHIWDDFCLVEAFHNSDQDVFRSNGG